jgi:tetratricopeptide (TPR) repeat protein
MVNEKKTYNVPLLKKIVKKSIDPRRAAGLEELAQSYLLNSKPKVAKRILLQALVLDQLSSKILYSLGHALYQMGEFESALSWLSLLANQGHVNIEYLRGEIFYDLGNIEQALKAFSLAIEADPTFLNARLGRAKTLMLQSNPGDAISDLSLIIKLDRQHIEANTLLATTLIEFGKPQEALAYLDNIEQNARRPEHMLHYTRAQLLAGYQLGEIEHTFEKGTQQFSNDIRLQLEYARFLISKQANDPSSFEKASSILGGLIDNHIVAEKSPEHCEALFLLAQINSKDPDNQDKAEALYHKGLSILPDHPEGLAGIGALKILQGQPSHGLPWLLQATMLAPQQPTSLEHLAQAFCAIADDEAVARWLSLLIAGLPEQAPSLLAQLLRFVLETGRAEAYQEIRREGHRMKNLVAVLANRHGTNQDPIFQEDLQQLYTQWSNFLRQTHLPAGTPSMFTPNQLIQKAIKEAAGEDPGQTNNIVCEVPSHLPFIQGNQNELTDAISNIIRNAIEASPTNQPIQINVRYEISTRMIKISVTDQGPGISLEDRRHIFDPGFSKRKGGSGLGLSICRRAVMSHGGRVSIASALGGPTTFIIRLPIASTSIGKYPLERRMASDQKSNCNR